MAAAASAAAGNRLSLLRLLPKSAKNIFSASAEFFIAFRFVVPSSKWSFSGRDLLTLASLPVIGTVGDLHGLMISISCKR